MELWLVRHAVAADRGEFDGPDAERPLTGKGRRRFRDFCEWLAGETPMPQIVVSSPLLRAVETAALLTKASGLKKSEIVSTDLLAPGVDVKALLGLVRDQPASLVALVGHEPDISHCLAEIVGGGEFSFGKGFVAAVEFASSPAIGTGRLRWFVGPKLGAGK
ncbi:MAG: SixA phosphatase family protein [Deltaproteobacteria bacterium]